MFSESPLNPLPPQHPAINAPDTEVFSQEPAPDARLPIAGEQLDQVLPLSRKADRTLNLAAEGYLPPSIGLAVARAHGITDDRPVITAANFAASHEIGTLPDPHADQYLQGFSVPAAQRGEVPVTLTLAEGLLDYYRGRHWKGDAPARLLEPDQEVVEVNPLVGAGRPLGFPYVDAMHCLRQQPEALSRYQDAVFAAAFPTGHLHSSLPPAVTRLQSADVPLAVDKAAFREGIARRGANVLPGAHIESESDLQEAVSLLRAASRVWLKAPGSGGDLVRPVDGPITVSRLREGIAQLRQEVARAFEANHYEVSLSKYWPEDRLAPVGTRIVAEQHVEDLGTLLLNGSMAVIIDRHGRWNVAQTFRQTVDPRTGEFRGGAPINTATENDPVVLDLFARGRGGGVERLQGQLEAVVAYAVEDLGFVGPIGYDFWLVEHADGEVHPYFCEQNPRPIMNYYAWVMAQKLGAAACMNVNIWTPHPLHSISDVERAVGSELLYGNPDDGLVFPMAMRSVQVREPGGELTIVLRSNAAKMLVLARDMDQIQRILSHLHDNRGVRFNGKAYADF